MEEGGWQINYGEEIREVSLDATGRLIRLNGAPFGLKEGVMNWDCGYHPQNEHDEPNLGKFCRIAEEAETKSFTPEKLDDTTEQSIWIPSTP